jgi:hypothetical protein
MELKSIFGLGHGGVESFVDEASTSLRVGHVVAVIKLGEKLRPNQERRYISYCNVTLDEVFVTYFISISRSHCAESRHSRIAWPW